MVSHPYFEELTFSCVSDLESWYWEAQVPVPGSGERVMVRIDDTPEGPGPEHEAFCRSVLADPDHLFGICRPVFEPEFATRVKKPWPADWRAEFKLRYLAPPVGGDKEREWLASYFLPSAQVSARIYGLLPHCNDEG